MGELNLGGRVRELLGEGQDFVKRHPFEIALAAGLTAVVTASAIYSSGGETTEPVEGVKYALEERPGVKNAGYGAAGMANYLK